MAKLIYVMNASLDGYIADEDGIARDMVGSGSYLVMDTTSAQTASARVAGQ